MWFACACVWWRECKIYPPSILIHSFCSNFSLTAWCSICSVLCYVMHAVMTSYTCSEQCTMSIQCAIFFLQFAFSVLCFCHTCTDDLNGLQCEVQYVQCTVYNCTVCRLCHVGLHCVVFFLQCAYSVYYAVCRVCHECTCDPIASLTLWPQFFAGWWAAEKVDLTDDNPVHLTMHLARLHLWPLLLQSTVALHCDIALRPKNLPNVGQHVWKLPLASPVSIGGIDPGGIITHPFVHSIGSTLLSNHTIPYRTIPYQTVPHHTKPYHTLPYHTIYIYTGYNDI